MYAIRSYYGLLRRTLATAHAANLGPVTLWCAPETVITSYSIHYTKLYEQQSAIETFRAGQPVLAVAVYFLLYVLVTALSLPGAALLTLAGGAVFGLLWGTVIVSFASTVGASYNFV